MKDSHDIVNVLLIYRETGILCLGKNKSNRFIQRHGYIQRGNILPVGHNLSGHSIIHLEDIGNHLCLIGFHNSLFMTFRYHQHDIFFRHIIIR